MVISGEVQLVYHKSMLEKDIPFIVERSKKRKRSIALLICPERGLVVQAPYYTSDTHIAELIVERKAWIQKKLQQMQVFQVKDDRYFYLGNPYHLEISPVTGLKNRCEIMGDVLFVRLRKNADVNRVVENWYRKEAEKILMARTQYFASLLQVKPTAVIVKTQKTRWGSCDLHNRIRYNWRIVMAAPDLLDYLVVHELAHIKEKNHSPAFWQVVESILPDYDMKRKALKAFHPTH